MPDTRLQKLADIVNPGRTARDRRVCRHRRLVKGANEGEGLGNQFYNIRETDAICEVALL